MADEMDLNLLRVFDAVVGTGSVTAAAARLHLSPPATSRALSRLRRAMGDPILVRAGQRLVPTPFAQRSAARVRALLDAAAELRADPADADPASWQRTFTVRLNDGLTPVLAPRLTRAVAAAAPDVRLRVVAQDSKEPDALRDGLLDLDVGVLGPAPPDVRSEPLLRDRFVAVVAAHSALGRAAALSLDDLCSRPHVAASRRGLARGPLDEALERDGRSRRVAAVVPSYAVGALMALESDVVALAPELMVRHLVARGVPLRAHEVPVDLPAVEVEMRHHRRVADDPAVTWLRARLHEVVAELGPPPLTRSGGTAPSG